MIDGMTHGSVSSPSHPASGALPRRLGPQRRSRAVLAVGVAVIVVAGTLALYYFATYPRTGPASFFLNNASRVPAGSTGCLPTTGEICYSFVMGTSIQDLQLSDLRFVLTTQTNEGPSGPRVPVGSGAGVTVSQPAGGDAGHWNWSEGAWSSGEGWTVPTNVDISIVFDSSLSDNASLNNTDFWIIVTGPGNAAVGDPLY